MAKASIKVETVEKTVTEEVTTYNLTLNYREFDLLVTVLRDSVFANETNKRVLQSIREAAESIYELKA